MMSTQLILWLQSFHPALDIPMEILAALVRPEFVLVVLLPVCFWLLDRPRVFRLYIALVLDLVVGEALRVLLAAPRPFWDNAAILPLDDVTSIYSSPAGYASTAVILFGYAASRIRRPWAWWVAGLLLVSCSLAKLYHGATHFEHLALGTLQGIVLLAALIYFEHSDLPERIANWSLRAKIALATGAAVAAYAINALAFVVHANYALPEAVEKHRAVAADRLTEGGAFIAAMLLLVVGCAYSLLQHRGGFRPAESAWKRVVIVVLGVVPAVVLFGPLRNIAGQALVPAGSSIGAYAISGLVNLLFGALAFGWVFYFGPRLMIHLGLARKAGSASGE